MNDEINFIGGVKLPSKLRREVKGCCLIINNDKELAEVISDICAEELFLTNIFYETPSTVSFIPNLKCIIVDMSLLCNQQRAIYLDQQWLTELLKKYNHLDIVIVSGFDKELIDCVKNDLLNKYNNVDVYSLQLGAIAVVEIRKLLRNY